MKVVNMSKSCFICDESDEKILILEKHHIYGKKYSKETVWLCLNCHKRITDEQNKLPVRVRKSYSRQDKDTVAIASIGALMKRMGYELLEISQRRSKKGDIK